MIDPKFIDDLAKRVAGNLPAGLQILQEDLQKNVRSALEAGLGHLELVTREEFELQRAVLARTREKLEQLEKQIEILELENRKQN
jgi:BMFP domain-containing protein YqiC